MLSVARSTCHVCEVMPLFFLPRPLPIVRPFSANLEVTIAFHFGLPCSLNLRMLKPVPLWNFDLLKICMHLSWLTQWADWGLPLGPESGAWEVRTNYFTQDQVMKYSGELVTVLFQFLETHGPDPKVYLGLVVLNLASLCNAYRPKIACIPSWDLQLTSCVILPLGWESGSWEIWTDFITHFVSWSTFANVETMP